MHKLKDRIKYVCETRRTIVGEIGKRGDRVKFCYPKSKYFVVHRQNANSLLIRRSSGLPALEFDKANRLKDIV